MNKIFVWSHFDLDGVVSYMVLKWVFKTNKLPCKFTSPSRFREDFEPWIKENADQYDKIFILDLDISKCQDLVDLPNISIYDHHATHIAKYANAKGGMQECSSASKLVYKIFSALPGVTFTDAQKKLILFADDYDSYTLKFPQSYQLNVLLFESQNKPFNFIEDFKNGFTQFNSMQSNVLILHEKKFKNILDNLPGTFIGTIKIQGKERKIVGTFADSCINEVADYISKKHNSDASFVVNLKSNHVSFRKHLNNVNDLDVSKIAATLCEGGGHKDTAGGILTEKFQEFTKLLTPINE